MKEKLSEYDKKLLKILKVNKGLTRFQICRVLRYKTFKYKHTLYLPSGIYYQEQELHHKRTTVYRHLKKLESLGLIYRQTINYGKQGRPYTFWCIK